MFFSLLFAAGADTTRNAAAGGVLVLAQQPAIATAVIDDDRALPTLIEETVRWTSPAAYNRRTATRDVVLGDQAICAGDKVVFWEASANRDERVFRDAMRFDPWRDPNPHLGFGHGIHHCLGANLARLELRVMYRALFARCRGFALTGPVVWARSNKHTGIRRLPIQVTPR